MLRLDHTSDCCHLACPWKRPLTETGRRHTLTEASNCRHQAFPGTFTHYRDRQASSHSQSNSSLGWEPAPRLWWAVLPQAGQNKSVKAARSMDWLEAGEYTSTLLQRINKSLQRSHGKNTSKNGSSTRGSSVLACQRSLLTTLREQDATPFLPSHDRWRPRGGRFEREIVMAARVCAEGHTSASCRLDYDWLHPRVEADDHWFRLAVAPTLDNGLQVPSVVKNVAHDAPWSWR